MNKYDWMLAGTQSLTSDSELTEEEIQVMLNEAFIPEREFQLFLCGAFVNKSGTLDEMESGLELIIEKSHDYEPGDYCIVSVHDTGKLLFMPIKIEDTEK